MFYFCSDIAIPLAIRPKVLSTLQVHRQSLCCNCDCGKGATPLVFPLRADLFAPGYQDWRKVGGLPEASGVRQIFKVVGSLQHPRKEENVWTLNEYFWFEFLRISSIHTYSFAYARLVNRFRESKWQSLFTTNSKSLQSKKYYKMPHRPGYFFLS